MTSVVPGSLQAAPKRVFLIGFMGAGKTTVGRVLAQNLGWKFYDLDHLIESREHQSIADIFARAGESGFRKIESAMLVELLNRSRCDDGAVIALGGGAFVPAENREALRRAGAITVLLSAPVEELSRRCAIAGEARPLARDQSKFKQLYASREKAYALASFRIETAGKRIHEVAQEIEKILAL
jgi:shikimate kinase